MSGQLATGIVRYYSVDGVPADELSMEVLWSVEGEVPMPKLCLTWVFQARVETRHKHCFVTDQTLALRYLEIAFDREPLVRLAL